MIWMLRGTIARRMEDRVVIETGGVGYEVFVSGTTVRSFQRDNGETTLFIAESPGGPFGGMTTLYGFADEAEREIFMSFKNHVPGVSYKTALDYLNRVSDSLPDFSRAIAESDARRLGQLYGFKKKTADKLIAALREPLSKIVPVAETGLTPAASGKIEQAIQALMALGFREQQAREAALSAARTAGTDADAQALLRESLKRL